MRTFNVVPNEQVNQPSGHDLPSSPAPRRPRLCIIAPCFNEELVIESFLTELTLVLKDIEKEYSWRVILVDDGSTDGTLLKLESLEVQEPRLRVYSFSRNFGHQIALTAGFDFAKGDAVIFMDSDLQHPPKLIPQMLAEWRKGNDVVSAMRLWTGDAGWLKRCTSRGFYSLFNLLSDVKILPGVADFGLLSKKVHRQLIDMPERHRFLRGMIAWLGYKRCLVPYVAEPRGGGASKYTFRKMLRLATDAVFSFTSRPIRLASRIGLALVVVGAVYLFYIVGRFFICGDLIMGWASMVGTTLVLGGAQLFFIGILGEYMARVFEEAKQRPLYVMKRKPARMKTKTKVCDSMEPEKDNHESD
jgi:dolichol-phosphate mannosyltransferase